MIRSPICRFTTLRRIGSAESGYGDEVSLAVIRDGSSVATSSRNQNGYIQFTIWNLLSGDGIQLNSQFSADPQAIAETTGSAAAG